MVAAPLTLSWITSLFAVCIHLPCLEAGRFLQPNEVTTTEIERKMLADLAESYHRNGSSRLQHFENALRPIYVALPKDSYGTLSHSAVRYALHRVFMQSRSWFIRGLDPSSDISKTAGTSKISLALGSVPILPSLLQGTLEHAHQDRGLNLRETAALAAALDGVIYRDAHNDLRAAYDLLSTTEDKVLNASQSELLIDTFMTIYLVGGNLSNWTKEDTLRKEERYFKSRRGKIMKAWLQGVEQNVHADESHYVGLEKVVDGLIENFGTFNSQDCHGMKSALMSMEGRTPGRVRLSDFYNKSRYSVWGFKEKIDYLRVLGVLDETNASNPQVIIPNYVSSMPQCLQASGVYSVCCRVECEDLLGEIERKVARPDADADQLVEIVERLSSDNQAPRKLSSNLVARINEVAYQNGGLVPIHGRLFAQWMHHAFPRDCPYPHKAGSTSPQTPDEWITESGHSDSDASEEEMSQHIRPDDTCPIDGSGEGCGVELPWSSAEELLVSPGFTSVRTKRVSVGTILQPFVSWQTQYVFYLLALVAVSLLYRDKLVKINKLVEIKDSCKYV